MSPGDGRGLAAHQADDTEPTRKLSLTAPGDDAQEPPRLPCRTRGCRGTRPLVPVGSSWLWDRCYRCARRVVHSRPYPVPDERPAVDPWAERVYEVLETVEGRCAA